ncbi:hypothetical protein LCGC14_2258880, partial [marine sediment metagenome]
LLSVRDLRTYFYTDDGVVKAVDGVGFRIAPAQTFAMVGESGCGKSLTALAMLGILPRGMKATGEVIFRGEDLLHADESRFRAVRGHEIAMVFQEPMTSLNPVLKVGYQIEEVINTHLAVSKKEAARMAVSLLRSLNIPSPEQRVREYPHQLSGGMRQRVMMAMAISCSPSLLIADEPTTALDVTIEAQLLSLMHDLQREFGMAIVFITHDLGVVAQVADKVAPTTALDVTIQAQILDLMRTLQAELGMGVLLITHDLGIIAENAETVAIMYAGRLVEQAPVAELFASPMHPYTIGLLNSVPAHRGTKLKPVRGLVPKPWELPAGCTFSDRCDFAIDACSAKEPDFIEVDTGHRSRCIRTEAAPWRNGNNK